MEEQLGYSVCTTRPNALPALPGCLLHMFACLCVARDLCTGPIISDDELLVAVTCTAKSPA